MERHNAGEARVVPIILQSAAWMATEFGKLEPLPKSGRPIAEWSNRGFAVVAEELRLLLVDLNYPRQPRTSGGEMHGHWILKVGTQATTAADVKPETIVERLQVFTGDYSICLLATAPMRVIDRARTPSDLILVLSGEPDAFIAIRDAQADGTLSAVIGVEALSFYIGYGSTISSLSTPLVGHSPTLLEDELIPEGLLWPGEKVNPVHLKAIKFADDNPRSAQFIIDRGDSTTPEAVQRDELHRQLDYFKVALSTTEDNLWVNLSAYESNRMIPQPLSGTQLGRDLLAQDCILKRLAASFMHPDNPIGHSYWSEVLRRTRSYFGATDRPITSFQKVWVVPKKAVVYELPFGSAPPKKLASFDVKRGDRFAYAVEAELDVKCECDLVAFQHQNIQSENNSVIDAFREFVLPSLIREVNDGEHFVPLRQIYRALILATWVKKTLKDQPSMHAFIESINTNKSDQYRYSISDVQNVSKSGRKRRKTNKLPFIDHVNPYDPAFDIPENIEFYQQYIRLFREGIFRCIRPEPNGVAGVSTMRVYFSGAIHFDEIARSLNVVSCRDYPRVATLQFP